MARPAQPNPLATLIGLAVFIGGPMLWWFSCKNSDAEAEQSARVQSANFRPYEASLLDLPNGVPVSIDESGVATIRNSAYFNDPSRFAEGVRLRYLWVAQGGARVRVVQESGDNRQIEVVSGSDSGSRGWVPSQFIR